MPENADGAATRVLGEATLQVPATLALAIEPARPNPAGAMTLAFTLPSPAPARIELLDVGGRRVASREIAGAAGRQLLRLEESLAPGVYVVRLSQSGRRVTGRVVVTN